MRTFLILSLALAVAASGCIQNMADLRDRVGGADEPLETAGVDPQTPSKPPAANTTAPPKPPVARISVFAPNGALLFKSTFTAEDVAAPILVEENATVRLVASDSETLEPGATLTNFTWTLDGQPVEAGRSTTVTLEKAGLYPLRLNVTDSNGQSDTQAVVLGVAPTPFTVETEVVLGPVAGAAGAPTASAEAPFALSAEVDGVAVRIVSATFKTTPPPTADVILDVLGPGGESAGAADDGGPGGAETVTIASPAAGDHTIVVRVFAGVAPENVVTVSVTYLPIVPGFEGDDGHGHAH